MPKRMHLLVNANLIIQNREHVLKFASALNHVFRCQLTRLAAAMAAAAATFALPMGLAQAAPLGGQVTSGAGAITQTGNTATTNTTITQTSLKLSLGWNSFNVAASETVNFVQTSASAIAVNRIADVNASQILGHINANGQVYLINPNGILFGQGAQVNVGGLVASTLDLGDASLNSATRSFTGNGTGSIVNKGTINAAHGGYVALIGQNISNQGVINAPLGTVVLGAGSAATLAFQGTEGTALVSMKVDQSLLATLVENGGLIRANGGLVIMTAGAQQALLSSVVNNTGVIEARTNVEHNGTIKLLGSMRSGTVNVGGTLDASAPNGGNSGFIETSAAHVQVASGTVVTTLAASGGNAQSGTWLIDPSDYTIAYANPGNGSSFMSTTDLSNSLSHGNVTVQTSSAGTGKGDIFINDPLSWSASQLTLNAQNNININAVLQAGCCGSLALIYGQGAVAAGNTSVYNVKAPVYLSEGSNFSTKLGSDATLVTYTVIGSSSKGLLELQGIKNNLSRNYVLGSDLDAGDTRAWNNGAGFVPIGTTGSSFTGIFDGLGHTIKDLTINLPGTGNVGLFGYAGANSVIQNVGLTGGSVAGGAASGSLVGGNTSGVIRNSYATGTVSAGASGGVGGLMGTNINGTITDSYATGKVAGGAGSGGLLGSNISGVISNSYATGNVTGGAGTGGLLGSNTSGSVGSSYASGEVIGAAGSGGLVGSTTSGAIGNSHATGKVTGAAATGGLIGSNTSGNISDSYALGDVSGAAGSGGLIGSTTSGAVSRSYATGQVRGAAGTGGLIGSNTSGAVSNSSATGSVNGAAGAGGLVGSSTSGAITNNFSSGKVMGAVGTGGLLGSNTTGVVINSYWDVDKSGVNISAGGVGVTTDQLHNLFGESFNPARFIPTSH